MDDFVVYIFQTVGVRRQIPKFHYTHEENNSSFSSTKCGKLRIQLHCPECKKMYTDKAALDRHRKTQHYGFQNVCEQCQAVFKRRYLLTAHKLKMHGIK